MVERGQGVFSFSDPIFQAYFTARKIVASSNLQASGRSLEQLVTHITEPRWREVFLLTAAMLRSADSLVQLMQQHIDAIVADDPSLQKFLKTTMTQPRNFQQEWHFSSEQQERLQRYCDARQLLTDCLNSTYEVTATVREIKSTL